MNVFLVLQQLFIFLDFWNFFFNNVILSTNTKERFNREEGGVGLCFFVWGFLTKKERR